MFTADSTESQNYSENPFNRTESIIRIQITVYMKNTPSDAGTTVADAVTGGPEQLSEQRGFGCHTGLMLPPKRIFLMELVPTFIHAYPSTWVL